MCRVALLKTVRTNSASTLSLPHTHTHKNIDSHVFTCAQSVPSACPRDSGDVLTLVNRIVVTSVSVGSHRD